MKNQFKKVLIICLMALMVLSVATLSFADVQDDYTILIYLNGTDLESAYDEFSNSFYGNATKDLNEMIAGYNNLGNINVIVQTGGTKKWANDYVSEKETQRFELAGGRFKLVNSLPNQNMGYKKTLSDFIVWGTRNYPANKSALILWNHGAGPVNGYGYDELFEGDSLQLEELEAALKTAKEKTGVQFEILGFDACLMASIEVADTVKMYANYLVASEELEPGHGWDYTGLLKGLALDPTISGDSFGKIIVDTYYEHSVENESASDITLSVIDLSKISNVVSAFETLITEASTKLTDDLFFYDFSKAALTAKSFGGNTENQGYTDLIDLKDFAVYLAENQEETTTALITAIEAAVIYRIEGTYTFDTSGLSIYFPYRDRLYYDENMEKYNKISFSPAYKAFLKNFRETLLKLVGDGNIEGTLIEPNDTSAYYQLVFTPEDMNKVYYIYIDLYTAPENPEEVGYAYRYLGNDFLVSYDEATNSYFEDFSYQWTFFETEPLMTFVIGDYVDLVEYESPVLYNDEEMNLLFAWVFDYETEHVETTENGITTSTEVNVGESTGGHYEIYGLRRGIDAVTGMPDKNIYQLEVGSQLTPLYDVESSQGVVTRVAGMPMIISADSELLFEELEDTIYDLAFRYIDFSYQAHQTEYFQVYK